MGMLMIALGIGFLVAFLTFIAAEEMSLKNANFSDMHDLVKEEINIGEIMGKYSTIKYMLLFIAVVFVVGLVVANSILLPHGFGLAEAMAYVFAPSLAGSFLILLVKWRYQPILKLVSSFMYGAGYMGASALALAFAFLANGI